MDNMVPTKKLWFRRKLYGWGWAPTRWQGWLVLIVYLIVLYYIFRDVDGQSHSVSDTLIGVFVPFCILTGILFAICYVKGEKPRWQWGTDRGDTEE